MSSPNENELVAGHAPAAKVGGMRVATHKPPRPAGAEAGDPPAEEEGDTQEEEVTEVAPKKDPKLVISGFVTKGDKDFPPEAVKAYHDKPQPTHENRRGAGPSHTINQPRK